MSDKDVIPTTSSPKYLKKSYFLSPLITALLTCHGLFIQYLKKIHWTSSQICEFSESRTPENLLSLYPDWCQAHQISPLSSQILAARNSITASVVVQTINYLELSDICFHPNLLALCLSVVLQRIEMSQPYSSFSMIPTAYGAAAPEGISTSKNISSSSLAASREGAVCPPRFFSGE